MPYTAVTLAALQTQLLAAYDGTPFWSASQARDALNEGLQQYNLLTGFWKQRISLPLVANEPWVTIPGTMVMGTQVFVDQRPLGLSAVSDLDNGRAGWETERTNTGADVPTRPTLYAPEGLSLIAIWPAPHDAPHSLQVDGVAATPVLVNPADYIDIGEEEQGAICGYALHALAFGIGGAVLQSTLPHFQTFMAACADRNARLRGSAFYRAAMNVDGNQMLVPARPLTASPPVPGSGGA